MVPGGYPAPTEYFVRRRTALDYRFHLPNPQYLEVVLIEESGHAGEFHPHVPTDPYVTVSRHTALIIQPPGLPGGFILSPGSSHLWLTKQ